MDRPRPTSLPPDLSNAALYAQRPELDNADEIRLIDLWIVLVRRKFVIAALVLVSIAFGLVYALSTPRSYAYTTIVEIGTNGQNELIEPLETARVKVADGYVAQVLQAHIENNSNNATRYEVRAEVPKNSQVLVLRSRGTVENEPVYVALHGEVISRLRLDHLRAQNALREDLKARLETRKRNLAELRQQAKLLETQLKRLEEKQELPARDLSYLMSLRLADNQRAQSETLLLIDNARMQLVNVHETSAVVSTMRSLDPVGLGKKTMVMLSGLIGLFLGIITALFVEFAAKTREETTRRAEPV